MPIPLYCEKLYQFHLNGGLGGSSNPNLPQPPCYAQHHAPPHITLTELTPIVSPVFSGLGALQKTSFLRQFVKLSFLLHKRVGSIEFSDPPVVKYHYSIRIKNGIDSVRNGDDSPMSKNVAS